MNSPLTGIPIERRRHFAATLGLFAVLFAAVGLVATTGTTPGIVRVFSAIALIVALLLGGVAWGVTHSVKIDLAEERLNQAIEDAIAARGGTYAGSEFAGGCSHVHDADEMHVSAEPCAHDGTGSDCTHSCDTCVLASLRPAPTHSRAERLTQ